MCGEKSAKDKDQETGTGSPPRVRGKGFFTKTATRQTRITPACAGKSGRVLLLRAEQKDHPRVCGEKQIADAQKEIKVGSPPRVRGKEVQRAGDGRRDGITPACAGKRARPPCCPPCGRDHPRVCGEKSTVRLSPWMIVGSPPRVRGKGHGHLQGHGACGITPACAGKRLGTHDAGCYPQDHPRVCGEKLICRFSQKTLLGSPPRVRGKARRPLCGAVPSRITPACAGKSQVHNVQDGLGQDHPRVCGEKSGIAAPRATNIGSPPRVRGKD